MNFHRCTAIVIHKSHIVLAVSVEIPHRDSADNVIVGIGAHMLPGSVGGLSVEPHMHFNGDIRQSRYQQQIRLAVPIQVSRKGCILAQSQRVAYGIVRIQPASCQHLALQRGYRIHTFQDTALDLCGGQVRTDAFDESCNPGYIWCRHRGAAF